MRFFIMSNPARLVKAKLHQIHTITRPFSFFDFIDDKFMNLDSLRRIFSQVRLLNGATMVVEEIEQADDLEEENCDIKIRFPEFSESSTLRLSFFSKAFKTRRGLNYAQNKDFIGYALIKSDTIPLQGKMSRIYESVIKTSRHNNNFIKGIQSWNCRAIDKEFSVKGYLYAQQNNTTNVCAHVAIRTAAACYHSDGDMSFREMNKIAGVDHTSKKLGGDNGGLTSDEMVIILESAGARCFVGNFENPQRPPVTFQKYLYGSIESGFPAIVCFGTIRPNEYHAVPIFGHTFSEDTWVPRADSSYFRVGAGTKYIPSESWLSMFVGHDDNWGSNFCIPRRYLYSRRICQQLRQDPELCPDENTGVAYVIATLPKDVKLDPIRAEVIGVDFLFTILSQLPTIKYRWDERLEFYARRRMLVLRPLLVRGSDYIKHLSKIKDWENKSIRPAMVKVLKENLPDMLYWLIELSVPELFSANRRKVGEVLIRSDIDPKSDRNFNSFVLSRLPGYFALYDGGGPSRPKYQFIPSGAEGHVELYGSEEIV